MEHKSIVAVRELPNNLKITTTAMDTPKIWWEESFLVPHEPMRQDIKRIRDALHPDNFTGLVQWKVDNFFRWYNEYFFPIVHSHHDVEEHLFIPWIQTRTQVPPKVADDHKELMRLLKVIAAIEQEFKAGFAKNDQAALRQAADHVREAARQLEEHLLPHLEEEERVVAPLLGQYFTEKELQDQINKIVQFEGLQGGKRTFPWILAGLGVWKGPEGVAKMLGDLPPPIRHLYKTNWKIDFEQNNRALLESLFKDSKENPYKPVNTSMCCSWWGLCCCFCRCCAGQ